MSLTRFSLSLLIGGLLSCGPAGLHAGTATVGTTPDDDDLAQFYGFEGLELYKLDDRVFNLASGDFNHDGLTDLVVVDNRASCLRLLLQKSEPDGEREDASQRPPNRVNELESDWRFDIRELTVDKQVAGMAVADFNGDGRVDIAYVGVPNRLIVRYQPDDPDEEWADQWSVRLPELQPAAWMIAAGDLNCDDRADVAVIGEEVTYVVRQNEAGKLGSPESLINTSQQLSLLQIADLNGDGRGDLCYLANEGSNRGLCARLQTADGRLGPELTFDLQQPRSVTLADVDQKPGREIVTIESRTGRLFVSQLESPQAGTDAVAARLLQFGVGKPSGSRSRAFACGDLDGDGLTDVVFADAEQAQLLVYRQNGIDGLGASEVYPALLGVNDICTAQLDDDPAVELLMISEEEGSLASTHFENGRLAFPTPVMRMPEDEEFVAVAFLAGTDGGRIVVCTTRGSGRSARVFLRRLQQSDDGTWTPTDEEPRELPAVLGSRGLDLVVMDVNGDQREDLLVVPNGSSSSGVEVLFQNEDGSLQSVTRSSDLDLGISSAAGMFPAGQRLLVARDAFARALSFGERGWQVDDQFNAGESGARLEGVAALDVDGADGDEIVLVDGGVEKLRILRLEDGLFRPWKEVELGSLRFTGSAVADLNGDGRQDLLLGGASYFAVFYAGLNNYELREEASFEIDREDAYPADVIAGDLNSDGGIDLSVIDTSIDGIQLLQFDVATGIHAVTHFRVFEEKRLVSDSNARGTEPREGLIVDVTGDGRNDLVILCHDRLILYPQDAGPPVSTAGD